MRRIENQAEKNFTVVKYDIKNKEMIEYLTRMAILSNNLTNTVIYHQRQWYFYTQNMYYTEHPNENFKPYQYNAELIDELKECMYEYNQNKIERGKKPNDFIDFGLDAFFLQYYLKKIKQPDYIHDGLSAQIAQQITSKVSQTFKAFRQAKKDYFKHPDKYEACPQLPRYNKKGGASNLYFTNQDTKIKNGVLRFPKTKLTLPFTYEPKGVYTRMEAIYKYGQFELRLVFKGDEKPTFKETDVVAAIDLGVSNLIAITTNKGQSLLVKDKTVKSINQYANKEISRIASAQTTTGGYEQVQMSKQLIKVYQKRHRRIEYLFYVLAKRVLAFCLENNVSKLALGKNKGWKQAYDKGKTNNQNFIQIPYTSLYRKITDLLTKHGVEVVEQEESYTSKASAVDLDELPLYGDDVPVGSFSGRRYGIHDRLYETSNGTTINADMNGALNILRKAFPEIELELNDLQYLKNPQVLKNMQA